MTEIIEMTLNCFLLKPPVVGGKSMGASHVLFVHPRFFSLCHSSTPIERRGRIHPTHS